MPEEYIPKPYNQRASANVGVGDYLKHLGFYTLLPLASGALGVFAGFVSKNKLPFINGRPPFLNKMYNRTLEKIHNTSVREMEEAPHMAPIWNFIKASFPVSIFTAYHGWRREEQELLDLTDVYNDLVQIAPKTQTQEKLEEDNVILKEQVKFFKDRISANEASLEGKVSQRDERELI